MNGEKSLYSLAIFSSLLLSACIALQQSVINPDAVCYILSAQMAGKIGLTDITHYCGQAQWPFYSLMLAGFAKLTSLAYVHAAYVLDALFSAISVCTFILICQHLGANKRTLYLAAATILLAHHFNAVREYIIRDHGYWAFYLLSLYSMLIFLRSPSFKLALCWNACIFIATLFRVEGAIFLLLVPQAVWFCFSCPFKKRAYLYFLLSLPLVVMISAALIWILFHPSASFIKFGRVGELLNQLQHGFNLIVTHFQTTKQTLSTYVLTNESLRDANLILIILFSAWYMAGVASNLTWIYVALVAYAWMKRPVRWETTATIAVMMYVAINLLITLGFLLQRYFLSKRYLLALSLTLMLWVPFALNALAEKHKRWYQLALAAMLISALGGIVDFGYSKNYLHEAGDWLTTHVPANATMYSDDLQLMYYSNHYGKQLFSLYRKLPPGHYDYYAYRFAAHAPKQIIPYTLMKTFSNKHGDRVEIYRAKEGVA